MSARKMAGLLGSSLSLRYALREMRGGLQGFYVFIICIALGTMAIAGVSSLAASLVEGLARDGRVILGGDRAFTLIHRESAANECALLDKHDHNSSTRNAPHKRTGIRR